MNALTRTLRFAGFTLLEYIRSGRILVEILITIAATYLFYRRVDEGIDTRYFFTIAAAFSPLLTLYTTSVMIGLADRPQGYILLIRRLSRANYLLGIFIAAIVVVAGAYGLLCIAVALINAPADMTIGQWLLGSLPLLLNICLLTALLLLLSPLVLPGGWRLFVLGLIAMAFSSQIISGTMLEAIPASVQSLLRAVQALLGGPLIPAFYGYQISVVRDYGDPTVFANLLAQLSLLIALLCLAVYSFTRRDVIFSSQ
jgi:ABC-type transport system involved in multi-copper enzyme maturation permease subunit